MLGYVRKACQEFDMIQDGDRIAVGISGGKDSLVLLNAQSSISIYENILISVNKYILLQSSESLHLLHTRSLPSPSSPPGSG